MKIPTPKTGSEISTACCQVCGAEVQHDMGVSLASAEIGRYFYFSLQPVVDIHLYSGTKYEMEPGGDIQYVYIFSALAFLYTACLRKFYQPVNCPCFKTCWGSRHSLGNGLCKRQLVFQFLTESVLLTLFAMLCAYVLMLAVLPYFNQLSDKNVSVEFFL